MTQRWSYLGPEGTFTEQAARSLQRRAGGEIRLESSTSVPAALAAVRDGSADAACVPLENSLEGSVPLTLDELTHGGELMIVAEEFVPITFDLLARPGTELAGVRTVGSHPHGHAQIREWLTVTLPDAEAVASASNAAAAQAVRDGDLDAAAAAPAAGAHYGLVSLAHDIGAASDAVTRFVLLRRPGSPSAPTGNDRTSLALFVHNRPGSLLQALGEFAARGINLTRMESRPARSILGEYVFLVDADGHVADPAMADVLAALVRRGMLLRFLGSYPRGAGTNVPAMDFATAQAYRSAAEQVRHWAGGQLPAADGTKPDGGVR